MWWVGGLLFLSLGVSWGNGVGAALVGRSGCPGAWIRPAWIRPASGIGGVASGGFGLALVVASTTRTNTVLLIVGPVEWLLVMLLALLRPLVLVAVPLPAFRGPLPLSFWSHLVFLGSMGRPFVGVLLLLDIFVVGRSWSISSCCLL